MGYKSIKMEKAFSAFEDLATGAKNYINVRIDEAKLSIADKASALIANFVAALFIILAASLCVIFLGIALSFYLNSILESSWLGFLIVAGVYFIKIFLIVLFKEKLIRIPVMNAILKQLTFRENE
jgi:hypothetical protein